MATYNTQISGKWASGKDVQTGIRCKLLTEVEPRESQFKNKDGSPKIQDVAKIKFEGNDEQMNIAVNRASIYGMVSAFGKDSKGWVGKPLTTATEKVMVGGKRQVALYLVPDGYEVKEDSEGYVNVVPKDGTPTVSSDEPNLELDESSPF